MNRISNVLPPVDPPVGRAPGPRRAAGATGRAALLEALQLERLDWFELPAAPGAEATTSGPGYQRRRERPAAPEVVIRPTDTTPSPPAPPSRRLPLRMPMAWVVREHRLLEGDPPVLDQPGPQSGSALEAGPDSLVPPTEADSDLALAQQRRQTAQQMWQRLRAPLRQVLDPLAAQPWRQPIDWRAVVAHVASGRGLPYLPRRQQVHWPGGCVVLLDGLAPSMVPLRGEMDALATRLRRSIGGRGAVPVLELSEQGPAAPMHEWLRDADAPPGSTARRVRPRTLKPDWHRWHGQTVLLLSDLAMHPRDAGRRPAWAALVQQALRAGVQLQALVPCAQPRLTYLPRAMTWAPWPMLQHGRRPLLPTSGDVAQPDTPAGESVAANGVSAIAVEQAHTSASPVLRTLLALMALCGEAHVVLLRGLVRLVVPGPQEAAWLWQWWNHADVERLCANQCRLRPERAAAHLQAVPTLPVDVLLRAFRLRRTLYAGLAEADEHAAVLRTVALAPSLAAELAAEHAAACDYIEHRLPAALNGASGAEWLDLAAGVAVLVDKALPAVRQAHRRVMNDLMSRVHEQALRRGEPLMFPPELGPVRLPVRLDSADIPGRWILQQQGLDLLLREQGLDAEVDPSALCLLDGVPRQQGITVVTGTTTRWLPLESPQVRVLTWDGSEATLRLLLGSHDLTLATVRRPRGAAGWTSDRQVQIDLPWGETVFLPLAAAAAPQALHYFSSGHRCGLDAYGVFVDLVWFQGDVQQRFRYIEPGSFWMGSTAEEQDRFDNGTENYTGGESPRHRVTLTVGYWLADTPCTQGLWEAVMGDNPSHFKNESDSSQHPVESVSWYRVQEFLQTVNRKLPAGCEVVLPTEAQWEYAARAGTESAYWWGEEPKSGKANWNEEQKGTTVVKKYEPNGWGFYDVHGNVWEWCAGSMRDYGAGEELDPPDGQDEYGRVLRGGGWSGPPGDARAAHRGLILRGRDWSFSGIGLRFALRSTSRVQRGNGAAARLEGEGLGGPPGMPDALRGAAAQKSTQATTTKRNKTKRKKK